MRALHLIMERVAEGNDASCFKLYACRGAGKGCTRNKYRERKIHCPDCVEARNEETLEQLESRLRGGDA